MNVKIATTTGQSVAIKSAGVSNVNCEEIKPVISNLNAHFWHHALSKTYLIAKRGLADRAGHFLSGN